MTQFYKIKVGIEEFSVEETDVPRIVEAMKSNDMVKLNCGIFRGNAILAVCRDIEKEEQARLIASAPKKTPEQLQDEAIEKIIKEQKMKCELCGHTGWKESKKGEKLVRIPCYCTILPENSMIIKN